MRSNHTDKPRWPYDAYLMIFLAALGLAVVAFSVWDRLIGAGQ